MFHVKSLNNTTISILRPILISPLGGRNSEVPLYLMVFHCQNWKELQEA